MTDDTLRFKLEYYAYAALSALINLLPRKVAFALGRRLGDLTRITLKSRVKIARDNLTKAFPEHSPATIESILRENFRHLGVSSIEMLRLAKLKPGMPVEAAVEMDDERHLREALDFGKGAIILSAHLGFWEVPSVHIPVSGYPLDFVARKLKNPYLDDMLQGSRTKQGGRFIDRHRGARKIVKYLGENRLVGILLDQHTSPKEAIRTDFFGRPCWTTPVVAQIAMKRGVPIIPTFCTRTDSDDYRLEIQPPLFLTGDAGDPEAVRANTQRLTDIIEDAIRRNVTQWFWIHKRWRAD